MKKTKDSPKWRTRREQGTKELLIWGIPQDLIQAFKLACTARKKTMKAVFLALMESFVKQQLPGVYSDSKGEFAPRNMESDL